MAWRPVRFPAALDGSDLSLKVIAGGRRLGAGARHIDGIVLAFRRSFEAGIFFDRERAMENVAFDRVAWIAPLTCPPMVSSCATTSPSTRAPSLIKTFNARSFPSTWPNTFRVPSPEILLTIVMPRLMVDT